MTCPFMSGILELGGVRPTEKVEGVKTCVSLNA